MPTDSEIHTLHRYFVWANRLRDDFRSEIQSHGPPPSDKAKLRQWLVKPFANFSMWMAMLYVVCEGWAELGLVDSSVESLLLEDHLRFLRRYRNGVFHFQRTYFDRRFTEFIDRGDEIGDWADDLHLAFSKYFMKWYRKKGIRYTVTSDADSELLLEIWREQGSD